MKDQLKDYRSAFLQGDFEKAEKILEKSDLKKDKRSILLWHLEKGSLALAKNNEDQAISHFQTSIELIDRLYTTKLSKKAASLLINDSADEFYGANYERSFAYYFLAKSLYKRFQKKGAKLDLQGARGTILAWDSYFSELQRSATSKTLYSTDLMLKIFGGQIHESSEIRTDKQIALQLYKDALGILNTQGGIFSTFNKKNQEYINYYVSEGKISNDLFVSTPSKEDLQDFLHFKILSLTQEIRSGQFEDELKSLNPKKETAVRAKDGPGNVVLIFEEGLIPQKVAKPFNFGLKGAIDSVDSPGAKAFISTVGAEFVTAFAMNKLGMFPQNPASAGNFIFAHNMTRLAVQEAAIEFELPVIETVPAAKRLEFFILDEKNVVVHRGPLPVISDNGDIARVVLEEDAVSRYFKTGSRIAVKHIIAIVAAIKMYQTLQKGGQNADFFAKTAAMATYLGASKGLTMLEKADTRHWMTLPQVMRMAEMKLRLGKYKVGVGEYLSEKAPVSPTKMIGEFQIQANSKSIFTFPL